MADPTSPGRAERAAARRWSAQRAREWAERLPWLVGANFVPSNAINQLEMWQAATFDLERIAFELDLAASLGMNTMRVFLHNLLWRDDPQGLCARIDAYLQTALDRGVRTMLVLFDSCWDPHPRPGLQRPPIPGVHNSGWVQAPGCDALEDQSERPRLRGYVEGVVAAFRQDDRILAWDVWNEPDNKAIGGAYGPHEPPRKFELVAALLPQAFDWARGQHPVQPLTSGLWGGDDWADAAKLNLIQSIQLAQSDVLTFHDYRGPELFSARVAQLVAHERPIICTEYLARSAGSTLAGILPLAKRLNVGAINWGLVEGKSQTYLPWDSWSAPHVEGSPAEWFHDVFRTDGRPYSEAEARHVRQLTDVGR